jgi:hypothetical protein
MHAFSLRSIDLLVIGLIAALSSSCGGEDVVADARIQAPRLGEASPPQSKPYAFSRSERIERVVGKLLGNTSNAALEPEQGAAGTGRGPGGPAGVAGVLGRAAAAQR